jgi:hypothetical protein
MLSKGTTVFLLSQVCWWTSVVCSSLSEVTTAIDIGIPGEVVYAHSTIGTELHELQCEVPTNAQHIIRDQLNPDTRVKLFIIGNETLPRDREHAVALLVSTRVRFVYAIAVQPTLSFLTTMFAGETIGVAIARVFTGVRPRRLIKLLRYETFVSAMTTRRVDLLFAHRLFFWEGD